MPDQVPDNVKRERMEQLVDVVQTVAARRNASRIGLVEEVLVEGPSRTDPLLLRGSHAPQHDRRTSPARHRPASLRTSRSKAPRRRRSVGASTPSSRSEPDRGGAIDTNPGSKP